MNTGAGWSLPFRYFVGILCLGALIAFLFYAREAVTNLVIAAFVAYLINPAVVYLTETTRLARAAAVNIVYFTAVILLVGVPATLAPIFYEGTDHYQGSIGSIEPIAIDSCTSREFFGAGFSSGRMGAESFSSAKCHFFSCSS
jgi:predicted PurR-regulated permease PerM